MNKFWYYNLGFKISLSGVTYIDTAIEIKKRHPEMRIGEVEKAVADKYKIKPGSVERNMRYAFQTANSELFRNKNLSLCLEILLALL